MTHATDPYAVLGVPRTASQDEIRQAYRRLAKRYHPDLHPDVRTSEQMRRINQAWETLSSPDRRAALEGGSGRRSSNGGHWTASAHRRAPAGPAAYEWGPSWASPTTAPAYARPASRSDDDEPGWLSVVGSVMVGLIVFVAFFSGILPLPLFGIVLLLSGRWLLGRFE